jgi:hypothetical protein
VHHRTAGLHLHGHLLAVGARELNHVVVACSSQPMGMNAEPTGVSGASTSTRDTACNTASQRCCQWRQWGPVLLRVSPS